MKKVLITGSVAYDNIMTFDGEFQDSMLHDKMEHFSLSFQTKSHEIFYGGCATNIAYTLKLLGDEPLVCSVAGNDFEKYSKWLKENEITDKYIQIDEDQPTAAAFILTDNKQNQLSFFSMGAMQNISKLAEGDCDGFDGVDYAIISPGLPYQSLFFAQSCMERKIPYIFDPGQAIPDLSKDALLTLIDNSDGLIMNNYEFEMISKKLNMTLDRIIKRSSFVIKTNGPEGCDIYQVDFHKHIPAIPNLKVVDPTGCGDAFRSGFLYGFVNGKPLVRACEMGSTTAAFSLEEKGTQNHKFTMEEFEELLTNNYGG